MLQEELSQKRKKNEIKKETEGNVKANYTYEIIRIYKILEYTFLIY